MAVPRYCPSCLSALSTTTTRALSLHLKSTTASPIQQTIRTAVASQNALKYRRKDTDAAAAQKKKKDKRTRTTYLQPDLKDAIQFSLVDAMRYLRAAEVGRNPTSSKYELHVRLRTPKSGQRLRNRVRLPHPVRLDLKVCVIAPPDSEAGQAAKAAGADLVGEESVFDAVKEGRFDFDTCLCHVDSLAKLQKAGVGRLLGPRGLMPSVKGNTVVKDVGKTVQEMVSASQYRERMGVVRLAIGHLGFTPEEMQSNIRTFVEGVRREIARLGDRVAKDIHEVVLSSTNGPGLSLNGELRGPDSIPTSDLSVVS